MIWATVICSFCFCWLYRASPSLAAKNIINLISVLTMVMSMCRLFSCVVGRGCLLWPVHSLGKTISLCPASFHIPRPNLPVTPGVSWIPLLHSSPHIEKDIFFRCYQPVFSKGDQSWVFFGRNDSKAETPVLWPPHAKSWLIGKDSDAGRDWGQEEKGTAEDEVAGVHHRLDGLEFEWTAADGDRQGGLAGCDSWGHKESDTTERLNWTEELK